MSQVAYVALIVCVLLALPLPAVADLIAEEGFDYAPPGTQLHNQNLGSGWDTAWDVSSSDDRSYVLVDSGYAYVDAGGGVLDLAGLGRAKIAGSGSSSNDFTNAYRTIDLDGVPSSHKTGGKIGADGSTIWLSFIGRAENAGMTSYAMADLSLYNDSTQRLRIGRTGTTDSNDWRIVLGEVGASGVPAVNQTFLVVRIDFQTGDDDVWMWLDPSLSAEPSTATANAAISATDFVFNRVRLTSGRSQTGNFDELRIGTSFSDVTPVPEPGGLVLAVLALLGIALTVSRRQNARPG